MILTFHVTPLASGHELCYIDKSTLETIHNNGESCNGGVKPIIRVVPI